MWTAPQNNYPAHAPASASGWSRPPQRPHSPPPPEGAARAAGIPEPPATFPDIAAMPLRDLEALAGDAARFDDYVSRHPHQKQVDSVLTTLREDVERLEEARRKAVSKAPSGDGVDGLARLEEKVRVAQQEVADLRKLQRDWLDRNSEEKLINRLRDAIQSSKNTCEELEKKLHNGETEYSEFMSKYISTQKQYHERRIKLQNFETQMQRRRASASAATQRR